VSTVIFHAREAGAATAMVPLLGPFRDAGFQVLLDVADHAAAHFRERRQDSPEAADIVICGYDKPEVDRTGSFLRRIAPGIPSIGLLDSWKGIDRFWFANGSIRMLTSRLAVPDDLARTYLVGRGMSSQRIVAVGHPALDAIRSVSSETRASHRSQGRAKLGIGVDDLVLVLYSEPLPLAEGDGGSLLSARTTMGNLLNEAIAERYGREYRLVCRRHPIEVSAVPAGWLDGNPLSEMDILSTADLVLGVGSTMLAYAAAVGCQTICLDDWLEHWLPEWSDIPRMLWGAVREGIFQSSGGGVGDLRQPPEGAADRMVNLAFSLLETDPQ
jgi:hypothetical protein